MINRRALAYFSLVLLALLFVAELIFPRYSVYIFYGMILWMFVTFFIYYGPTGRATAATAGRPSATRSAPGAPVPGSSGPATQLDFCVYCGAALTPDLVSCPACGKPVRPI
jgi:hypothetical protein